MPFSHQHALYEASVFAFTALHLSGSRYCFYFNAFFLSQEYFCFIPNLFI